MTTAVDEQQTDTEVEAAPALPDLTSWDRCDRCGAQAYVRVLLFSLNDLLFCGHHSSQHQAALDIHVLRLKDQRSALDTIPPEVVN
jgi:hypothetical protein